jgi:hypothetical protein
MRLPDWKTCAGYLAVIAALALSLPGVRAVRANDEVPVISVKLVDSALSCDANSETSAPTSATVFLAGASDRSEESHPVALNTRGYSYRPPHVDPEAREFERR